MRRLTNADLPCDTERVCLVGSNRLGHGFVIVGQRAVRHLDCLQVSNLRLLAGPPLPGRSFCRRLL